MNFLQALRNVLTDLSGHRENNVKTTARNSEPEFWLDMSKSTAISADTPEEVRRYNIPTLPVTTPMAFQRFMEESPSLIYKYFLKCLKKAIKADEERAVLFYIPVFNQLAVLMRAEYEPMLNKMCKYFISIEEYEQAGLCKRLMSNHAVNEVIRNSK